MKKLSVEHVEKLIGKMVDVIKPNGVLDVDFKLSQFSKNKFYMDITYVVPDVSEYLNTGSISDLTWKRIDWNNQIKNSIKNYFNIDVIIGSSGVTSKSFHEKNKI